MNVRDSWQAKLFERQGTQQKQNMNCEFRRSVDQQKLVQQAALIKLRTAALAACMAWSFAGVQWLR